jgi:hypothetical protein
MNVSDRRYAAEEIIFEENARYLFISRGHMDAIKIIEFEYVGCFCNETLYNLAFGDYDVETKSINDDVNTNNGDVYTVFNTVLSVVPRFFEIYQSATLMVQGSDSREDFLEKCRLQCRKKCSEHCRDFERRINVYRGYVNRNFRELCKTYAFWGGIECIDGRIMRELYQPGKKYDIVYVAKKRKFGT